MSTPNANPPQSKGKSAIQAARVIGPATNPPPRILRRPSDESPPMKADRPYLTLLIDGECPLCRHEARLLGRLDRGRGRLALVDIADPDFDPAPLGRTLDDVMGSIHAVRPDGSLVTGMEAFRRAYAAVGLGWLLAPTAWPVLRPAFDAAYRFFAKHRLRITGRGGACAADRCRA
jgi:predicted DCC family thiol-disulfide oxidoreductase YuxK